MRVANPKLSFVKSWEQLQASRPDLFVEVPEVRDLYKFQRPKGTPSLRGALKLPQTVMASEYGDDVSPEVWNFFAREVFESE